ncbi:pyridoxal 5'-phosphate synthase [Legionella sp. km772]|uniref:pyridoxine/pyridoxamine 5'-phosphate oxidase n=1 Tax=Legionella sp. km772 TaxID=2498111 RepID=UPI000F8C31D7|nr:pyridoxal 5'-phosphate synthase [Legionella sp. km772]RUR06808.1 pyridoxal 5'-phosphate synthase [Legionella sp. km772]
MPISTLKKWLDEEKIAGVPNPAQAVLSTCTGDAIPHSRVVAIREITDNELLFFTQQGTRKVNELEINPMISLTFWFELTQRQIIIEGRATALSVDENENYWISYPRIAQLRFCAYAPTSSQRIDSKKTLEDKKIELEKRYSGNVPMPSFYCGYRIQPHSFLFYRYRVDELSDVFKYENINGKWKEFILSP